jgi:hypothetical protein
MGMGKKLLNWTMKKERMQKEALSPLSSRSPKKDMGVWKWDFPHKLMIFFYPEYVFSEPMDLLTNPIRRCEMVGIYHGS